MLFTCEQMFQSEKNRLWSKAECLFSIKATKNENILSYESQSRFQSTSQRVKCLKIEQSTWELFTFSKSRSNDGIDKEMRFGQLILHWTEYWSRLSIIEEAISCCQSRILSSSYSYETKRKNMKIVTESMIGLKNNYENASHSHSLCYFFAAHVVTFGVDST